MEEVVIWKPVVGYEGLYEINQWGIVKSLARIVYRENGQQESRKDKLLSNCIRSAKLPYLCVVLYKDKVRKMYNVHRLVAIAFFPNPNNYPEVNHIDGNKGNCYYKNLEWCTSSQNTKHSYSTGLQGVGGKHGQSKIDEAKATEIKRMLLKGISYKKIAQELKTTNNIVFHIKRGDTWKHIKIDD